MIGLSNADLANVCSCNFSRQGSVTCDCGTTNRFRVKQPTNVANVCTCNFGRTGSGDCDCETVDLLGNTAAGNPSNSF